jgi:hypothetical protein
MLNFQDTGIKQQLSAKKFQNLKQLDSLLILFDNLQKFNYFAQEHSEKEFLKMEEILTLKFNEQNLKIDSLSKNIDSYKMESE